MDVLIKGKHISISETVDSHIHFRADKLKRFYERILSFQVTVAKERRVHRADVVIHVPSHTLKTSHQDESIGVAIDRAIDKVQRQLKKLNTKIRKNHRPRIEEMDLAEG